LEIQKDTKKDFRLIFLRKYLIRNYFWDNRS